MQDSEVANTGTGTYPPLTLQLSLFVAGNGTTRHYQTALLLRLTNLGFANVTCIEKQQKQTTTLTIV